MTASQPAAASIPSGKPLPGAGKGLREVFIPLRQRFPPSSQLREAGSHPMQTASPLHPSCTPTSAVEPLQPFPNPFPASWSLQIIKSPTEITNTLPTKPKKPLLHFQSKGSFNI